MKPIFYYIIEFLLAFVLVQLYYFIIEKIDIKQKDKTKRPAEISIFLKLFNIDQRKINYKKLSKQITFINSINIAIVLLLTEITKLIILKILIIFGGLLLLTYISYSLLGYIYKKKGMVKNV